MGMLLVEGVTQDDLIKGDGIAICFVKLNGSWTQQERKEIGSAIDLLCRGVGRDIRAFISTDEPDVVAVVGANDREVNDNLVSDVVGHNRFMTEVWPLGIYNGRNLQ